MGLFLGLDRFLRLLFGLGWLFSLRYGLGFRFGFRRRCGGGCGCLLGFQLQGAGFGVRFGVRFGCRRQKGLFLSSFSMSRIHTELVLTSAGNRGRTQNQSWVIVLTFGNSRDATRSQHSAPSPTRSLVWPSFYEPHHLCFIHYASPGTHSSKIQASTVSKIGLRLPQWASSPSQWSTSALTALSISLWWTSISILFAFLPYPLDNEPLCREGVR